MADYKGIYRCNNSDIILFDRNTYERRGKTNPKNRIY